MPYILIPVICRDAFIMCHGSRVVISVGVQGIFEALERVYRGWAK